MNVLILTPDRVGSTLLQRLMTIYMLRKGFDRPVINLHELTNGLTKYYNTELNQEMLTKPDGPDRGYYQTLPEITELLSSVDHYKTSRLAQYHIVNRNDPIDQQLKFYEYLNDNFYIISCLRENLLEHALSWIIKTHSKRLNVYSAEEKIDVFYDLYKNGITATREAFTTYLDRYVHYLNWVSRHFHVQQYFNYEQDVPRIEEYILNLDFMQGADSWETMFGQSFNNYNQCHALLPNLVLSNEDYQGKLNVPLLEHKLPSSVPATIKVSSEVSVFLERNLETYKTTNMQIAELVKQGYLVTGLPLKLQTLSEKQRIIKNFDQCVTWYTEWKSYKSTIPLSQ